MIIVLPNQTHPEQYHLQKEETFVILHGEVELILDGVKKILKKGDVITIEKEVRHEFSTKTSLNSHQKTAKYCLKIQATEGVEIKFLFKCEFCSKILCFIWKKW